MKKIAIALVMIVVLTSGAFAQIVLGVTGAQYYQEDEYGNMPSVAAAWDDFKEGTSVYWGGFAEIILGKVGLGLAFNQQTYSDPINTIFDMWNYDTNLFLSYHFFGGKAFLDPFLEAGVGIVAFDYINKDRLRDEMSYTLSDDPLMGSAYFDFGLGLGINLGGIGIFSKVLWNIQSDKPLYDNNNGYYVDPWPVMPLKWFFGAQIAF